MLSDSCHRKKTTNDDAEGVKGGGAKTTSGICRSYLYTDHAIEKVLYHFRQGREAPLISLKPQSFPANKSVQESTVPS